MIRYLGLVFGIALACDYFELSKHSETLMGFLFG